jgi:hypothetical protein
VAPLPLQSPPLRWRPRLQSIQTMPRSTSTGGRSPRTMQLRMFALHSNEVNMNDERKAQLAVLEAAVDDASDWLEDVGADLVNTEAPPHSPVLWPLLIC